MTALLMVSLLGCMMLSVFGNQDLLFHRVGQGVHLDLLEHGGESVGAGGGEVLLAGR